VDRLLLPLSQNRTLKSRYIVFQRAMVATHGPAPLIDGSLNLKLIEQQFLKILKTALAGALRPSPLLRPTWTRRDGILQT
jgi:hypothetical protein